MTGLARRLVLASIVAAGILAGCTDGGNSNEGGEPPPSCEAPEDCPLRTVADERGVVVGTAIQSELLDDETYTDTIVREFNSVTPERDLKWDVLQPELGVWDFEPADRIVEFAQDNDLAVKGHTLIWAQESVDATPDWVEEIDDPEELDAVLDEHINTVMEHYRGSVDRWDVVNEPLQTGGTELYENHFMRVLGPGYIADAFRQAHEADPDARLFLNENIVEYLPAKRDALVELVTDLVENDVPIDGVGLQLHLIGGPPEPGVVAELVATFTAMNLDVAITELDVPLGEGDDLSSQAATYQMVLDECLTAGCRDVTFWGFTDAHTWINDFIAPGLRPLLFDEGYEPKPSYNAVWSALDNDG